MVNVTSGRKCVCAAASAQGAGKPVETRPRRWERKRSRLVLAAGPWPAGRHEVALAAVMAKLCRGGEAGSAETPARARGTPGPDAPPLESVPGATGAWTGGERGRWPARRRRPRREGVGVGEDTVALASLCTGKPPMHFVLRFPPGNEILIGWRHASIPSRPLMSVFKVASIRVTQVCQSILETKGPKATMVWGRAPVLLNLPSGWVQPCNQVARP